MEIQTVNPTATIDLTTSVRPPITFVVQKKTDVFDANLQKWLLSQYKRSYKIKSEEYAKLVANKKALITIIFGQFDEATRTKIALGATYAADRQAGSLIAFLEQLRTVCFGSDDCGLSYGPYKQIVAVKLMDNYTNNEPCLQPSWFQKNRLRLSLRSQGNSWKIPRWNGCSDGTTQ